MLKKLTSVIMVIMLFVSIVAISLAPTIQAMPPTSGDYYGWKQIKCDFDRCGTQDCVITLLAICFTGRWVWAQ